MSRIPIIFNFSSKEITCTICLLPMQYQTKKEGKFLWQCFKCGKQYFIPENFNEKIQEKWSPPR